MYDVDFVRKALPLIWHDKYLLGEGDALPPDPDMPRAPSKDPHAGEKILAIRADMQRAVDTLTVGQRGYLMCRYGLDLTFAECERITGIADSTLSDMDDPLINAIVDFLNGDVYDDVHAA